MAGEEEITRGLCEIRERRFNHQCWEIARLEELHAGYGSMLFSHQWNDPGLPSKTATISGRGRVLGLGLGR
jgi:hypothetical protein